MCVCVLILLHMYICFMDEKLDIGTHTCRLFRLQYIYIYTYICYFGTCMYLYIMYTYIYIYIYIMYPYIYIYLLCIHLYIMYIYTYPYIDFSQDIHGFDAVLSKLMDPQDLAALLDKAAEVPGAFFPRPSKFCPFPLCMFGPSVKISV